MDPTPTPTRNTTQAAVGAGVLLLGIAMGIGAVDIPSAAGYGGVGPSFLAWLVSGVLAICGVLIVREALTGGFREMGEPSGGAQGWWPGVVWVSAGLLVNAALIERIGFILGCALCYLLAVQGLRRASAQPSTGSARTWAIDAFVGLAISAPVYWAFTQFLGINLPGLTGTGWI